MMQTDDSTETAANEDDEKANQIWQDWPLRQIQYSNNRAMRGIVAQRLERRTLIHEVVGSNPAVVILSVLPKG